MNIIKTTLVSVFLLGAFIALGADQPAQTSGNLRYTISVSEFDNESGWSGQWDIGKAFPEIMTDALQASGKFIVLGETEMQRKTMKEQTLAANGRTADGKKAPNMDQITPAQLQIKGVITHIHAGTVGSSAGLNNNGFRLSESKDNAEVDATIYLIDTLTRQVNATTKVKGKTGKKGLNIAYSGSSFTKDIAGFRKDNVGKACENAVAQAVEFLVNQLKNITWKGIIVKTGSEIMINHGSREGVRLGQIFTIGMIENIIDDETGKVLDTKIKQVGKLKVTKVKEKISYCEAIEGKDKIENNMTVMPAQ